MDCEHVAQTWPLPVSSCTSGAAIPTPLLVIFSFSKRASEPQYPCPCCNLSPLVPFPLWQPASQLLIGLYTSILPNPRVSLTYRSAWEQFALRITELLSVASSARLVGWLWCAESCCLCTLQPFVSSGEAYPYMRAMRVPHIASWCCACVLSDSVHDLFHAMRCTILVVGCMSALTPPSARPPSPTSWPSCNAFCWPCTPRGR